MFEGVVYQCVCVDPSAQGRWARRQLAAGCLAGEVEVLVQPAGVDLRETLAPWRDRGGADGLQLVLVQDRVNLPPGKIFDFPL